jgi:TRAP-type C4-dicarboxylate transport system permease small subunit
VWVSYITHDVSPASDASPLWIPQLAMALGGIALALAFAEDLVDKLAGVERTVPAAAEMARSE